MSKKVFQIIIILFIANNAYSQPDSSQHSKWYNHFSLSGYFQFQYHHTDKPDSLRLHSISAGNFERNVDNKFMIRRSRIRVDYKQKYATSALSFDVTERGIRIKDAWLGLTEQKWKAMRLTMGMFAMPFGHEIELQSMDRETPERSRVIQTLFPGIRDVGANFRFQLPDSSKFHFVRFDAGIYHGTHGNIEADGAKDFNGRIYIENPIKRKWLDYSFAYSQFRGKVNHVYDIDGNISNYHYIYRTIDTTIQVDGVEQSHTIMFQDYLPNELNAVITDSINPLTPATFTKYVNRKYQAVSAQFIFKPSHKYIGKTTLRAEYIWGDQVSQEGTLGNPYVFSSQSPTGPMTSVTWPKFDSPQPYNPAAIGSHLKPSHTFMRKFKGLYLYVDHQLGKTNHHLVYKYDFYDPNTQVKGDQIKLNVLDSLGNPVGSTGLSPADIAYKTHGIGYRYVHKEKLSLMVYYEIPRNEITALEPLSSTQINLGKYPSAGFLDDIKDNVLTIRIQYIF